MSSNIQQQYYEFVNYSNDPTYILEKITGRTLELTLNRPEQSNGFTAGMYQRFADLMKKAEKDDKIDSVLIKSNGKNFSSGNDLNNYSAIDFNNQEELKERIEIQVKFLIAFTDTIINFPKPIICCCQGATIGFIFPLLSLFDQVFVTKDAYFFAPMVQLGLGPEMIASVTFPKVFGHQKAFSLLIQGERLTADEAVHFGFALKKFESTKDMYTYAEKVCEELSELDQTSVVNSKKLMRAPNRNKKKKLFLEANRNEMNNYGESLKKPNYMQIVMKYMQKMQQRKAKL